MRDTALYTFLVGCLLAVSIVAACGFFGVDGTRQRTAAGPTIVVVRHTGPAPTLSPTAVPTHSTVSIAGVGGSSSAPSPAAAPAHQPTTSPSQPAQASSGAAPSVAEADGAVRDWFKGVADNSPRQMEAVTSGRARQQTDDLINSAKKSAEQNGTTLTMQVPSLTTSVGQASGDERTVTATYEVDVYADLGITTVKAREMRGTAVFHVARLPEGVRIVLIEGDIANASS